MKNEINIKLNKWTVLFLLGVGTLMTAAEYVSVIDGKSATYSIEKETMTVGAIVLRLDDTNPSTIYGGTWELIQEDATFGFGDGRDYSGGLSLVGENEPLVPLPQHTHSATFKGNALSGHKHDGDFLVSTNDTRPYIHGYSSVSGVGLTFSGLNSSNVKKARTSTVSAGTPTGSVSVTASGTSGAKLDVRGKRLMVNVWKRIG